MLTLCNCNSRYEAVEVMDNLIDDISSDLAAAEEEFSNVYKEEDEEDERKQKDDSAPWDE